MKPEDVDSATFVDAVAGGGSVNRGEDVVFAFKVGDKVEWFRCPNTKLHKIVDSLRSFGQIAAHERKGRPAGTDLDEIIYPYMVRRSRTGRGEDGGIGIQFSTHEGIPVTVAMPRNLAETLVKQLQDELQKPLPRFVRQ